MKKNSEIVNEIIYSSYRFVGLLLAGGQAMQILLGSNRKTNDIDYKINTKNFYVEIFVDFILEKNTEFNIVNIEKNQFRTKIFFSQGDKYTSQEILEINFAHYDNIFDSYNVYKNENRLVRCLGHDAQFAEKIRAFYMTKKYVHLYDIFLFVQSGVQIDSRLLEKKLKVREINFNKRDFANYLNLVVNSNDWVEFPYLNSLIKETLRQIDIL